MKNIITAITILVLTAFFIVVNAFVLYDKSDGIYNMLESGDLESAYETWLEDEHYFSVFIHHRAVDIVREEAENLYSYLKSGAKEDCEAARVRMLAALDELRNGELPYFYNIF